MTSIQLSIALHDYVGFLDGQHSKCRDTQAFSYEVQVMLVDPVIAADGHTYERAAFQDWLHHSAMSPVDGIPLKHTRLVTNQAIRNALAVQQRQ